MSFNESLQEFFKYCRAAIKQKDVLLCMGNEACDIDSLVSSLVMAMHERAIFVVNMSRRVFQAKGDIMRLVQHCGIDLDDLIFMERPRGAFSAEARRIATVFRSGKDEQKLVDKTVRLVLTDHNRPVPELEGCQIELIIDHHVPGSAILHASRLYIDVVAGSCATLVTKFIGHSLFSSKHNKCHLFESRDFCIGVGALLMVPILVDTKNLRRVTSHFDKGEFNKLRRLTGIRRKTVNKLRKEIQKSRFNDDGLGSDIILLKDYKAFSQHTTTFGVATVKYSFRKWVDREAARHDAKGKKAGKFLEFELSDFRRNQGLDFFVVNRKAGKHRYIALLNCPYERVLAEENHFELKKYKDFYYYSIPVDISRKLLVPILKKLIDRTVPVETKKDN